MLRCPADILTSSDNNVCTFAPTDLSRREDVTDIRPKNKDFFGSFSSQPRIALENPEKRLACGLAVFALLIRREASAIQYR